MTGSKFFRHPSMPQVRSLRYQEGYSGENFAWKCICVLLVLIAVIPTRLLVKCQWRTLLRLKPCSEPPRRGNVLKNYIHKKEAMHGQIRGLLVFYQSYSHHLVRWYPLWNIFFPVNCTLRIWLKFSLGCVTWHLKRLMIEKWALRNFRGWPKQGRSYL